MEFLALPESLRELANSSVKYFRDNHGYASFEAEKSVKDEISYRTTLKAKCSSDGNIICVEVMERLRFSEALAAFVLDCRTEGLPIKLYLVLPQSGDNDAEFRAHLAKAQKYSVGVCEVGENGAGRIIHGPISQSLAGLRAIDVREYPKKFRASLTQAIETFRTTHPAKGCQALYDELEALTRKIAIKADSKNLWKPTLVGTKPRDFNSNPWFGICEFMADNLLFGTAPVPPLKKQLINQIAGITSDRNETGHKPATFQKLLARDLKLRSRFENAADIFKNLIEQSKNLKP